MTLTILKTESFQPLGPAKPRPQKPAADVQIKPGIWQLPDGRLETRDPKVDEAVNGATAKPFHSPKSQVPNALGDGWIACGPDMPNLSPGEFEYRADICKTFAPTHLSLHECFWERESGSQYRLLPKEPA